MKESELQDIIQGSLTQVLATAYCFSGDERSAGELVNDACRIFLIKEVDFLQSLEALSQMKSIEKKVIKQKVTLKLIKYLVQIGNKRFADFKTPGEGNLDRYSLFFKLPLEQRLVQFFKFKLKKNFNQISHLMGLQKHQVIQIFYNSKENFLHLISESYSFENELLDKKTKSQVERIDLSFY